MTSIKYAKQQAAKEALQFLYHGITLGVGTGTTVYWFILALGKLVREGLDCIAVPTSEQTRLLAIEQGIRVAELNEVKKINITVDGADEIDQHFALIKGGGGALLQEKMIAYASDYLVIIADDSKRVKTLGAFPLPVEVVPYGWKQVQRYVKNQFGITALLRKKKGRPLITDHGHYILDCAFKNIPDPASLNSNLHLIPGVVETGLFVGMADTVIIADREDAVVTNVVTY